MLGPGPLTLPGQDLQAEAELPLMPHLGELFLVAGQRSAQIGQEGLKRAEGPFSTKVPRDHFTFKFRPVSQPLAALEPQEKRS